jgi:MFS family permease
VEESLVESTALLAAAIGALLFGRVAEMVGRKRIYGVEVLFSPRLQLPAPSRPTFGGSSVFASFSALGSAATILSPPPL